MLTDRQEKILKFIRRQQTETGITPTTREIQASFAFASQTTVVNELRALQRAAKIAVLPRKARAIVVDLLRPHVINVPVFGHIPAGLPETIDAVEGESVAVDARAAGLRAEAQTFALRVRGDSMIGAHILDGDLAIMEIREPRHHDIVAALLDGGTTLKRLVFNEDRPFLKAENPGYPDLIPAQELVIQGVLVMVVRAHGPT